MDYYSFINIASQLLVDDVTNLGASSPIYQGYINSPGFWTDYIRIRYNWRLANLSLYDARLLERLAISLGK